MRRCLIRNRGACKRRARPQLTDKCRAQPQLTDKWRAQPQLTNKRRAKPQLTDRCRARPQLTDQRRAKPQFTDRCRARTRSTTGHTAIIIFAVVVISRTSGQGVVKPHNDCVHLPGRLQRRGIAQNKNGGPVRCNVMVRLLFLAACVTLESSLVAQSKSGRHHGVFHHAVSS